MQIVITEGQLSDLFFNYDNSNLANAYSAAAGDKQQGLSDTEVRAALRQDAIEFAECYGTHADVSKREMVEWLVDDYMSRR